MKMLVAALIALAACSHGAEDAAENAPLVAPKDALTKVTDHGPVKATVTVWPAKPSLGDPIYVRLEVDSAPGTVVDVPFQEAGEQAMGRFRVVAFNRETKHGGDGHTIEQQTYTVDAPGSGRERIPPFRMTIAGSGSGAKSDEVLTEEVQLEVAPVKSEALDAKLHAAAGPLDTDVGDRPWWIVGLVGGVLVVVTGGILLARVIAARRLIQQQRSAYDEAIARLRVLEQRGAPTAELADTWFVDLSALVRRYLEQRYTIRAPELTTEEFLFVATRAPGLTPEHRAIVTDLLRLCDRVKFAGYRPEAEESLATLEVARNFVEDTRLREGNDPHRPAPHVPAARKVPPAAKEAA